MQIATCCGCRCFGCEPHGVVLQLTPRGRHIGALRLNTQGVFLRKGFGYHKEDIGGARVNLTGGYRFNGTRSGHVLPALWASQITYAWLALEQLSGIYAVGC